MESIHASTTFWPEALGLPKEALDASWECLRKVGNLSSASVLLVLEEVFKRRRPGAKKIIRKVNGQKS